MTCEVTLFPCYKCKHFCHRCRRQAQPGFQNLLSLYKLPQVVIALQPDYFSSNPLSSYYLPTFSEVPLNCRFSHLFGNLFTIQYIDQTEFFSWLTRVPLWEEGSSSILTMIGSSVTRMFYIYIFFKKLESWFWYRFCWSKNSWLFEFLPRCFSTEKKSACCFQADWS